MGPGPDRNALAEKLQVTVVLRLVLDRSGELEYGAIVDAAAQPRGRFVGWGSLTPAVRAWVLGAERNEDTDGTLEPA